MVIYLRANTQQEISDAVVASGLARIRCGSRISSPGVTIIDIGPLDQDSRWHMNVHFESDIGFSIGQLPTIPDPITPEYLFA